jgi:hypothetical protein
VWGGDRFETRASQARMTKNGGAMRVSGENWRAAAAQDV